MKNDWQNKYIREPLSPNSEFTKRCRTLFLEHCKTRFKKAEEKKPVLFMLFILRSLSTGVIAILITASASVYADKNNVGIENALYPLKRTYERIERKVINENKKEEVLIKLTVRRLEEANKANLKNNDAKSELLEKEAQGHAKELLEKVSKQFEISAKAAVPIQENPNLETEIASKMTPANESATPDLMSLEATEDTRMEMRSEIVTPPALNKAQEQASSITNTEITTSTEIQTQKREESVESKKRERICAKSKNLFKTAGESPSLSTETLTIVNTLETICEELTITN